MLKLVLISLLTLLSFQLNAQNPLVVNIDNPSFRKILVALPQFNIESGSGPLVSKFGNGGSAKLSEYLNFSGFFNVISESAYKDYMTKMVAARKKTDQSNWLLAMNQLSGDELVQWRSFGVDSLTLASIKKDGRDLQVTFKTFDVSRNEQVLAKKYDAVNDFVRTLQDYGDHVLKVYTGKPGIFSSKLTFVGRRKKGASKQIFISDFDGSNLRQITKGNVPHLSPSWSPDGRYVAYTSFESGNPHIYIYDSRTGSKRQLTKTRGLNSGANWSPDGKYIAYTASNGGDTDIYVIPSQGGKRKLLIKGSGLDVDPKFAPNNEKLAFVSGRYGNPHIFVGKISYSGSFPRIISDQRLTYAGWYNSTPSWSPESDKIIFGGYDKDIDRYDIFIMNANGSSLERLTLKTGDNESPSWAPNGQMIVFQSSRVGQSNQKGRPGLFVMGRDGSGQRRLDIPLYEAQTPHWGP